MIGWKIAIFYQDHGEQRFVEAISMLTATFWRETVMQEPFENLGLIDRDSNKKLNSC